MGRYPRRTKGLDERCSHHGVLCDGYVEAIGHCMWIGPKYQERTPGADLNHVRRSRHRLTQLGNGLLELRAGNAPFVDATTRDVQVDLRALVFPVPHRPTLSA